MTTPLDNARAPVLHRARVAVSALFFCNGAMYASILPRYPEIKAALRLSDAAYGLAIAALPVGALLSGLAAATLVRRFGSARLAAYGSVALALAILAVGLSTTPLFFALALFVVGLLDSVTDVAQNAHGLRVQRGYRRSIINGFHAIWSLGAVAGGLLSAGAVALRLPLVAHVSLTGALFSAVALMALRSCLPGPDEAGGRPGKTDGASITGSLAALRRVAPTVVALALIAIAGVTVEDVGGSWSSLYLRESLGAPGALAALGYISLVGFHFLGRLLGDGMVDRLGQRTVARLGGLLAAVGMGAALAFPTVPSTLLGFAAAGFGVATLVPAALQAADALPGLRPGTGLALLTWLMRLGFLLSPPVIGLISDASDLRTALLVVPVAGVLVLALSGVLRPRS
ncbi:MAG: MFS transporter [Trueperaceae bacterium]|nr:MFS transporter [Trueperaceae bacterium]